MTDDTEKNGARLDLSALDLEISEAQRERITAKVMARVHSRQQRVVVAAELLRVRRHIAVATGALAGIAAALLVLTPAAGSGPERGDPLQDWVMASDVPSNAQLLAAFQGYGP